MLHGGLILEGDWNQTTAPENFDDKKIARLSIAGNPARLKTFRNSWIETVDTDKVELEACSFTGTRIGELRSNETTFTLTTFKGAKIRYAAFNKPRFIRCDFTNAHFKSVMFMEPRFLFCQGLFYSGPHGSEKRQLISIVCNHKVWFYTPFFAGTARQLWSRIWKPGYYSVAPAEEYAEAIHFHIQHHRRATPTLIKKGYGADLKEPR